MLPEKWLNLDRRVNLGSPLGGDLGLGPAAIALTEQDRPRQVRVLDPIAVGHENPAHPQKCQVLEDLVPQRPAPITSTLAAASRPGPTN